jgi:hypothetical protein
MKFFAGDVAAAVNGLQPVTGATVELIRIDNEGNQIGDVITSTVTSITGDYTLTLPTNVDLAGNLIVRITGAGNSELRAQVVQQEVDISPVSEFILRKFIENETDLQVLDPEAVVKLSGHVQEFDLTAGSDLSGLFAQLEAAVGEFIDGQIDVIQSEPDSATSISGNYRSAALQLVLHDSNDFEWGTFAVDMWRSEFVFNGNLDGAVEIEHLGEETAWGSMHGDDGMNLGLDYSTRIDDESDSYAASFNKARVLTIEGEFDEEIEEGYALRWPPVTYRLQKVPNQNLFFQLNQEAAVRYETIDTDDDGVNDALNPDAPVGDEASRGIEVFYKKATDLETASVNGAYGRIYLGVQMSATGNLELEVETNELTFNNGSLAYGAAERNSINRNAVGENQVSTETTEAEELSIEIATDGRITVEGEPTDGYFNDTADFAVMLGSHNEGQNQAGFAETFFVKLPQSAPDLANKRYRLMYLNTRLSGTAIELSNSRFDSFITFTNNTVATAELGLSSLSKAGLGFDIFASAFPASERAVTVTVGDKGATTLQINAGGGYLRLKGYWNSTASYGLFTTGFVSTGPGAPPGPETVGLAVLVEVTD